MFEKRVFIDIGLGDNHRDHSFTPFLIGHADDRGVEDGGVAPDNLFDFAWIGMLTPVMIMLSLRSTI